MCVMANSNGSDDNQGSKLGTTKTHGQDLDAQNKNSYRIARCIESCTYHVLGACTLHMNLERVLSFEPRGTQSALPVL